MNIFLKKFKYYWYVFMICQTSIISSNAANDTVGFDWHELEYNSQAGFITIRVNRTNTEEKAYVDYQTIDGSLRAGIDYSSKRGRLEFDIGESKKWLLLSILNNSEGNLTVQLSNPSPNIELKYTNSLTIRMIKSSRQLLDPLHYSDFQLGDINGDGILDIYVGNGQWHEMNAFGTIRSTHSADLKMNDKITSQGCADIDGDGDLDFYGIVENDWKFYWWENINGNGLEFEKHDINPFYGNILSVADIDEDGKLDIIEANQGMENAISWWRNSNNSFTNRIIDDERWDAGQILVEDIDGDKDKDIIISVRSNATTLYWWENKEQGTIFDKHILADGLGTIRSLASADLNSDGNLDILLTSNKGIYWWKNLGNRKFSEKVISSEFTNAKDAKGADFDNDGDIDVVAIAPYSNVDNICLWKNTSGNGETFMKVSTNSNSKRVTFLEISDLDNDGDNDILTSADSPNGLCWWENKNRNIDLYETLFTPNSSAIDYESFKSVKGYPFVPEGNTFKVWLASHVTKNEDRIFSIYCENRDRLLCPEETVIPSGQKMTNFDITVIDNNINDNSSFVDLFIYDTPRPSFVNVRILDNDHSSITIDMPSDLKEGKGYLHTGTIKLNGISPRQSLTRIYLSSDNSQKIHITEKYCDIQLSENSSNFSFTISDNKIIDKDLPIIISADPRHTIIDPISIPVLIQDNENDTIAIEISDSNGNILKQNGDAHINFGSVNINTTSSKFITLKNIGDTKIDELLLQLENHRENFSVSPYLIELEKDEKTTIELKYTPKYSKTNSTLLYFYNSKTTSNQQLFNKVKLTADGVISIADGLDQPQMQFQSSTNAPWIADSFYTTAGSDADCAHSGTIRNGETSSLEVTIQGPKKISFLWKCESTSPLETFNFSIDKKKKATTRESEWMKKTFSISKGNHTLKWSYTSKNGGIKSIKGFGFVDSLVVEDR